MPSAMPPCGGAPYSNASSSAPNFSRMPSSVWPISANERSSRSRRWMRTEPPPSSQPLSAMSYCSARAWPAGSSGDGVGRVARRRHEQVLVLRHDAAEGVVGGVPAPVVGVPLVHREAVDPDVATARWGPSPGPAARRARRAACPAPPGRGCPDRRRRARGRPGDAPAASTICSARPSPEELGDRRA